MSQIVSSNFEMFLEQNTDVDVAQVEFVIVVVDQGASKDDCKKQCTNLRHVKSIVD